MTSLTIRNGLFHLSISYLLSLRLYHLFLFHFPSSRNFHTYILTSLHFLFRISFTLPGLAMPPVLRIRDPQRGLNGVRILRGWEKHHGQRQRILKAVIPLPSAILANISEEHPSQSLRSKRPRNARRITSSSDHENSSEDQDLSSLDFELNQALSSTTTVGPEDKKDSLFSQGVLTQKVPPLTEDIPLSLMDHQFTSSLTVKLDFPVVKKEFCPVEPVERKLAGPEYRLIPPNLTLTITSELADDDEMGMISKMIFLLKDPLSATKISLPVKSIECKHFECFDYETFCQYNNIPLSIRMLTRRNLVRISLEMKKMEKKIGQGPLRVRSMQRSKEFFVKLHPAYLHAPPKSYKCPICDVDFRLGDMLISDTYNFFVKTTPKDVSRVELVDMVRYRILDDNPKLGRSAEPMEEIIVLDDSEDEEGVVKSEDLMKEPEKGQENLENGSQYISSKGLDNGVKNGLQKDSAYYSENQKMNIDEQNNRQADNSGQTDSNEATFDFSVGGIYQRMVSEDVFDDGLDEALFGISKEKGTGSWEDPVTID